jgi:hypothetical protein
MEPFDGFDPFDELRAGYLRVFDRIDLSEVYPSGFNCRWRAGKRDLQDLRSSHLIGFTNRFESPHILSREFLSDFFKVGHGLGSVQTLSTMQAHFGFHLQDGSIRTAFKDLFDLFLHKFPAADGTFFK